MNNSFTEKTQLFANFTHKYGERLEKFRPILQYLNTYPEVISALKIGELIKPEELENHQKEWVWLVSQYDGLEKTHFKPYWVPVERENFNFFIDISNESFPLFDSTFYISKPYSYFNTILFDSITSFMLLIENQADFSEIASAHQITTWKYFKNKVTESHKLIFEGQLELEKPNFYEIFEEENLYPQTIDFDGEFYTITCKEVSSIICGLLPFSLCIDLEESGFHYSDLEFMLGYDLSIIKSIRELTHSIRLYGNHNLGYYSCFISEDKKEWISYKDNQFELKTSDIVLKNTFIQTYNDLMNEQR